MPSQSCVTLLSKLCKLSSSNQARHIMHQTVLHPSMHMRFAALQPESLQHASADLHTVRHLQAVPG